MDNTFKSQVKLGNGALVEAKGKGTLRVQTKERDRFIRDVLLVPDLDQNFLSVGQLLEHDYKLDFEVCKDVATKAHIVKDSWLWPTRFGHLNFQGLKLLIQKNIVQWLPTIEDKHGVCEGCALGKYHHRPFMKEITWRAKEKLELVHTDVCGPMRTPSNAQNSLRSKGYKLYSLNTNKIIISQDILFDENATWNWEYSKTGKENLPIESFQPQQMQMEEEGNDFGSPQLPPWGWFTIVFSKQIIVSTFNLIFAKLNFKKKPRT
ncbi:hypothetical protein RJ640_002982 [Escallonia rubra]|uniref:GAG-pre-integrase domain-containing protein n=1 Tax=Escallonia rubra TaxID=112253 RepID=A0AA88UFH7_9ASTE|nr:hypothetical protein RJ640_002982 [Escallonia rubra]